MGIRFFCPHCQGKLHVKSFLAGKRGICPHCEGSLRIPEASQESPGESFWYVRPPDGGEYGPAETPLMDSWLAEGRVAANALVWRTGWPEWQEAASVFPGLFIPKRAAVTEDSISPPLSPPPPAFTGPSLPATEVDQATLPKVSSVKPEDLPPPVVAEQAMPLVKPAPTGHTVPASRAEGRYRRRRGDRKSWWVTTVIFLGLTAAALLVTLLVVLMNQATE